MSIKQEMELREATTNLVFNALSTEGREYEPTSEQDYLTGIALARVVADEGNLSLARWVSGTRRAGVSWKDIGETLGISRQAAQQRFGHDPDATKADDEQVVISGATAFNEMSLLARAGEDGLELMGVGMLALICRKTEHQWAYRRTVGLGHRSLTDAGWHLADAWFPFRYYKRMIEN